METELIRSLIAVTAAALIGLAGGIEAQQPQSVTVSGRILGATGHHPIHIAVWDAKGFLRTPFQESFVAASGVAQYAFTIPVGQWAISAYEDRNGDGELNMGMFGPKEPSGFWPPYRGRHRPRFTEVAQLIEHDMPDADITLR
jgi:uncharacterized protein (DUF2141 family)